MKKYINIILASAFAALTVLSCAQKEIYEPGTPDPGDCYGVFFPSQDAMGSHTYDPSMERTVSITVTRTNTNGAITVPFTTTVSEEGVFNFGTISFADGQSETELDVAFPNAPEGKEVSFSVQLNDDNAYVSHYNNGAIALDFSVLIVTWKTFTKPNSEEPAVFTITHRWGSFGPVHATLKYYEVNGVRTGVFTSIDKDEAGNPQGFWHSDPSVDLKIRWYVEDQDGISHSNKEGFDFVELPKQYFGYDYNDGDWLSVPIGQAATPIYVYDYPWYWVEKGYNWGAGGMGDNWLDEANKTGQTDGDYPAGYYDGNGGFYFNIFFYIPGLGGGWSPDNYGTVAVADGFVRTDYSLALETDYSSDGVTPVYVTAGADVTSLKYAVYEGELNSAQLAAKLEAITAGSEATETYDAFEFDEKEAKNYGAIGIAPETSGAYTVIAVACDKDGKIQNSASVVINHISADDTEENLVELSLFTEETPSRYKEIHGYDSFAYGVSGTGLTEVHIGIISEKDVTTGEAVMAAVKGDASLAVSEEVLAQINADGGYYTIARGLKAKTTYYVIVWATNGALDGFAVDSFTTDPLPYVWNSLGKGEYTDDVACGLYEISPVTVSCNVYEEASTPGLYAIDGFQLPLVAALFEETEEEMAKYEGGNWRNSFIIINATNPESVTIELQDYGVCLDPDDGFIDGVTSLYKGEPFSVGTLKDGVISFQTPKGLLCTLNGDGYYYANQNGAFKLVLPEAAAGIAASKAGVGAKPQKALREFAVPLPVYERDAKPVKVSVEIPVSRKEKSSAGKILARPAKRVR